MDIAEGAANFVGKVVVNPEKFLPPISRQGRRCLPDLRSRDAACGNWNQALQSLNRGVVRIDRKLVGGKRLTCVGVGYTVDLGRLNRTIGHRSARWIRAKIAEIALPFCQ